MASDNDMDSTGIYSVDCCGYAYGDQAKVDIEKLICNSVLDT